MEDPIVRQVDDGQTQQAASLEHSVEETSEVQIDSALLIYCSRQEPGVTDFGLIYSCRVSAP